MEDRAGPAIASENGTGGDNPAGRLTPGEEDQMRSRYETLSVIE